MQLHRDLGVTQKSPWYCAHRIRRTWGDSPAIWFAGLVEIDETYFAGTKTNMPKPNWKRQAMTGTGTVGRTAVAGVKDWYAGEVVATVVSRTDAEPLQRFARVVVEPGSTIITDDHGGYRGLRDYTHAPAKHSAGECVRRQAHTKGIESCWSMLKRRYIGTHHYMSVKHSERYVDEFSGRNNMPDADTLNQMDALAGGFVGKRSRYGDLPAKVPR